MPAASGGAYGAVPYGAATRREQAVASDGPPGGDGPGPGGPGGDGDGTGSRRPVALVAGGIVALALVAAGAYLGLQGGDGGGGTATDGDSGGEETPATDAPTTAPTTVPPTTASTVPPGPYVQINDVQLDGGFYRVNYQVSGYTPEIDGGPESLHIHFFLDTTLPENAGNNGNPVGDWNLTDEPQSFLTDYGPDNKGAATKMCSAVATVTHDVHNQGTSTGNCVDLPA